ncbi:glycosyl transferase [Rhizobium sp. Root274]|uniref:glycosyltransferase family protein n=1 Tax=unclassified Rhizobium TaxID=2613769 RepID=UPI000713A83B|nr:MULTISPECIES: glycosyltransferase [unclassified Rhizobium]KQW32229.1 glycosyl transferase [Rhizobium sp. Root1240]KRD33770.1 glycosyl transferase [Rhizobium sp. Root274]
MTEAQDADRGSAGKVFFYVQHLLGIGHLARASRISRALVQAGFDVTLVTGGAPVAGFPGAGIGHVQLPAVVASNNGFSALSDLDGNPVDAAFEQARTARLLDAFHATRPDVVILEAFPFGRRQVRFELLPLIQAIEAAKPRPLLFSSIRDILQENRKAGRDRETVDLIRAHFDGVLVHGAPEFVRLEETFALTPEIADRVHYTGLVAPPAPEPSPDRFDTVISAGGGAVGSLLIGAALEARTLLDDGSSWCVITGPNLPQADYDRFEACAGENVSLFRFRPDFPSLLPAASLSISQAGYNTVCDLLVARCRALLVPFAAGGETEQCVRAEKLQALGLARIVSEEGLTGKAMAEAILATRGLVVPQNLPIALDGAAETARFIRACLDKRTDTP